MNLANVIAVLKARWLPAVLAFTLVFGAAIAYTMLAPKMYTATATLVIDIKPDPVTSMLYGGAASPAFRCRTRFDTSLPSSWRWSR